ncbi:glycosyltransferase family 4 protein [Christiangramia echinicola]|uniref:Glycosyltransferase involved in cell wall bisynthesis n=1 Tax=Christiangramia echinicola TaxID=279359 RepID=A0A1H1L2T6_9FLAO|nr:glycosyltransferase family 4 protein [Christiangramia echinicola]SDR68836.1 Glycosyltransferase involved in cell wall bisynthesis [Christiangramia echinicola]
MRLAVFTHVIHKKYKDDYYAYSPYVREINLWIKNADKVDILAPLIEDHTPEKELKYIHRDLNFHSLPAFNLLSFSTVFKSIFIIPVIFLKVILAMRQADHFHIRCPGNIGLIACIAQVFFPQKPKSVKYAGNWDHKANQPWTYNLQKWILKNRILSNNIKVLVYGNWGSPNRNIQPFYTASFSEKDKAETLKDYSFPFEFIYVGNLVRGKGVFQCIDLVEEIKNMGFPCHLKIFGDGMLKDELEEYILKKDLCETVSLMGRKDINDLKVAYKAAHFVILLSKSEGWPKALAEGMWYGAIPISTRVSCVPWMLGNGKRGLLIDGENISLDVTLNKIKYLLRHPETMREMSRNSINWAQRFTLKKFERDIKKFL